MAKIASEGLSGPLAPESVSHSTQRSAFARSALTVRLTLDRTVPYGRPHAAVPPAVTSPHHRDSYRQHVASPTLALRHTIRGSIATPALCIRNMRCNISALLAPLMRDIWRTTRAYYAPPPRGTRAAHALPQHCLGAFHPHATALYMACVLRMHAALAALHTRLTCTRLAPLIAPLLRTTRASVVAYRRECDAILAPMNPPLFPHTRATPSPLARHTDATRRHTPVARGGLS